MDFLLILIPIWMVMGALGLGWPWLRTEVRLKV